MLSAFPACFFQEGEGYSVIFPDLGYLATCGDTLDDALTMAVDCLAGYLYTAKRKKESVPAPSSLGSVDLAAVAKALDLDVEAESFTNLITVDVAEYAKNHFEKSVKKTLTIPAWLNDAAEAHSINFSKTLQDALCKQLHYEQ